MPTDDTYTAVVDRFEGDLAVLSLEDDGETIDQLAVEESTLPEDGRHVDAVVIVELEAVEVIGCTRGMKREIDQTKPSGGLTSYRSDHRQRRTAQRRPERAYREKYA